MEPNDTNTTVVMPSKTATIFDGVTAGVTLVATFFASWLFYETALRKRQERTHEAELHIERLQQARIGTQRLSSGHDPYARESRVEAEMRDVAGNLRDATKPTIIRPGM